LHSFSYIFRDFYPDKLNKFSENADFDTNSWDFMGRLAGSKTPQFRHDRLPLLPKFSTVVAPLCNRARLKSG